MHRPYVSSRYIFLFLTFLSASSGGPYHTKSVLLPGEEKFFDLSAQLKEEKKVEIAGNGKSDLDCSIFDDKAHIVAKVDDPYDYCLLEFKAISTHYTIMIRNIGLESDTFYLNSN